MHGKFSAKNVHMWVNKVIAFIRLVPKHADDDDGGLLNNGFFRNESEQLVMVR